ncbi:hypothetical protein J2793_007426 [Paraburkholderia caledonica]|uniref:Uncharacterized protein n=1 Tax=Paraburkholderia caledonica TaxID=134536 RepID=A0AB73IPM9_9BURK|nr:hypothetical protein [Paraburkholderia caledonica]
MQRYLDLTETADRTSPTGFDVKTVRLQEKIAVLRQQMRRLKRISRQLQDERDKQLPMTDPHARSMATKWKRLLHSGYSIRAAVSLICC